MSLWETIFGSCKNCATLKAQIEFEQERNIELSRELASSRVSEREFIGRAMGLRPPGEEQRMSMPEPVPPQHQTRRSRRKELELADRKQHQVVTLAEQARAVRQLEAQMRQPAKGASGSASAPSAKDS